MFNEKFQEMPKPAPDNSSSRSADVTKRTHGAPENKKVAAMGPRANMMKTTGSNE